MIHLSAGDLRLVLDPDTGGAIASLSWRGTDALRPVANPRLHAQHGRAVAAYPLIPFANRIAGSRFGFAGEDYHLAPNFGDEPTVIHGNAWMHPWNTLESGEGRARLALDFAPAGALARQWPFAYRAEQAFELSADRLLIRLAVQNRDTRPFPAGIGLHPYVARTPQAALRFEADTIWTSGPDGLPAAREAVHGAAEFAAGRTLGAAVIDSCYAGWGGVATMALPESGIEISVSAGPPLDHLQLYTPAGRDFIGLEPVSNMPDAVNRMDAVADHGLVVLPPGATLAAQVTIGLRPLGG